MARAEESLPPLKATMWRVLLMGLLGGLGGGIGGAGVPFAQELGGEAAKRGEFHVGVRTSLSDGVREPFVEVIHEGVVLLVDVDDAVLLGLAQRLHEEADAADLAGRVLCGAVVRRR